MSSTGVGLPPVEIVEVQIEPTDTHEKSKVGALVGVVGCVFDVVNRLTGSVPIYWRSVFQLARGQEHGQKVVLRVLKRKDDGQVEEVLYVQDETEPPRQDYLKPGEVRRLGLLQGGGRRLFLETPVVVAGGTLSVKEAHKISESLGLTSISRIVAQRQKMMEERLKKKT